MIKCTTSIETTFYEGKNNNKNNNNNKTARARTHTHMHARTTEQPTNQPAKQSNN
jgi:hypothetical protein